MTQLPFIRTQSEIATDISARINDAAHVRWSAAQVYASMNRVILNWGERVKTPFLYTLPDGLTYSTLTYTLPSYLEEPFELQAQVTNWPWGAINDGITTNDEWAEIHGYGIVPSTTGGWDLYLYNGPSTTDARLIYWAKSGPIPIAATLPVLDTGGIDSDDTSLVLTTKPVVAQNGYVKIDAEVIAYHGWTEAATKLTLVNLVRGLNGTAAAAHLAAASVEWCVPVPRYDLYEQLEQEVMADLMWVYMLDTAAGERDKYRDIWRMAKQEAADFWQRYVPAHPSGRMRLARSAHSWAWRF